MKFCNECRKGCTYDEPAIALAWGKFADHEKWGKVCRGRSWKSHLCDYHSDLVSTDLEIDGKELLWFRWKLLRNQ